MSLGKRFTPVLTEIEDTLWEFNEVKLDYPEEAFRAILKIFMSALMDKMWDMQVAEGMDFEDMEKMAEKAGNSLRDLVKTYTGIDTYELYR